MADKTPLPQPLPDKYQLTRKIWEDASSTLYEATNIRTKRHVFLRIWHPMTEESQREALAQRVRSAVAAKSEHVVQIFDLEFGGPDGTLPILVLENLRGLPLGRAMEQDRPMPVGRACWIAQELAETILACHGWGIRPVLPDPNTVFLTSYAGRKDFVKVFVPNTLELLDEEAAAKEDARRTALLLWQCLTGQSEPPSTDEATLERQLVESGVERADAEILARIVADVLEDKADLEELAARIRYSGLAVAPSRDHSLSFDARVPPSLMPEEDLAQTVLERREPVFEEQPEPPPQPTHFLLTKRSAILLAGMVGFLLGASSTALVALFVVNRQKRERIVHEDKKPSPPQTTLHGKPLKMAVAYYSPTNNVFAEMSQLVRYLSWALRRPVKLVDVPHERAAREIDQGKIQIGVFSPYLYVLNKQKYRHIKLLVSHLADGNLTYQGFLLVRADSPISDIHQVKGKRICFVSRTSTSGYLYPLALLKRSGIDPDRDFSLIRFSGTHEAVIEDLAKGRCDVGAVSSPTYFNRGQNFSLRILAVTDRIPGDAYCVTDRLPKETIDEIRRAFLDFNPKRFLGKPYLGSVHRITGFQEVDDSHYDSIRRVHLEVFGSLQGWLERRLGESGRRPLRPSPNTAARPARPMPRGVTTRSRIPSRSRSSSR